MEGVEKLGNKPALGWRRGITKVKGSRETLQLSGQVRAPTTPAQAPGASQLPSTPFPFHLWARLRSRAPLAALDPYFPSESGPKVDALSRPPPEPGGASPG